MVSINKEGMLYMYIRKYLNTNLFVRISKNLLYGYGKFK
jgi:hypothetical protein